MNKFFLVLIFNVVYSPAICSRYIACKLIKSDSTMIEGFAIIPKMLDDFIYFKTSKDSKIKKISNTYLQGILFYEDNKETLYERVLTYRNYANKKPYEEKSWLKVIKKSYMSLYLGSENGSLYSPGMDLWYCKKITDTIGYYITMKYTGGMVMTIDVSNSFKKYASFYFSDYKELADKITEGFYKKNDLETIVDEYNKWFVNKK